jgi:hypothetical protein
VHSNSNLWALSIYVINVQDVFRQHVNLGVVQAYSKRKVIMHQVFCETVCAVTMLEQSCLLLKYFNLYQFPSSWFTLCFPQFYTFSSHLSPRNVWQYLHHSTGTSLSRNSTYVWCVFKHTHICSCSYPHILPHIFSNGKKSCRVPIPCIR